MNQSGRILIARNGHEYHGFGPLVKDYRDYFDLAPLFEETILSILPSLLFLALASGRIAYLYRQPRCLEGREFRNLKLVSYLPINHFIIAC
jgi:hypothetical protein